MKLTQPQLEVLKRIRNGVKLFEGHNQETRESEWWFAFKNPDQRYERVSALTVKSLVKRGLIEPTGMLYWRISDAGYVAMHGE